MGQGQGQAQGARRSEPPAFLSAHKHNGIKPSYLAGFQDLEHEGQALGDELLRVLFLLNGLKLLQQALNERPAVLLEGDPQRLQPGVQGPRDTWKGGRWGWGRGGEGRKQPEEKTCFYLEAGLSGGRYHIMRPRACLSMNRPSVAFSPPQRPAEVEIKGSNSIPFTMGV